MEPKIDRLYEISVKHADDPESDNVNWYSESELPTWTQFLDLIIRAEGFSEIHYVNFQTLTSVNIFCPGE